MLAFIFEIVTALFSLQEGKNESLFSRERIVGGEWLQSVADPAFHADHAVADPAFVRTREIASI